MTGQLSGQADENVKRFIAEANESGNLLHCFIAGMVCRAVEVIPKLAADRYALSVACEIVARNARQNHPDLGGGWYFSLTDAEMAAIRSAIASVDGHPGGEV